MPSERQGERIVEQTPVDFTAIPYYAWAHRGPGEMAVWLPRTVDGRPSVADADDRLNEQSQRVGAEMFRRSNDQREPANSNDHASKYLHWWPHKGTKEWVQYDFASPGEVRAVEVYWFDDTGNGECRVPGVVETVLSPRRQVDRGFQA